MADISQLHGRKSTTIAELGVHLAFNHLTGSKAYRKAMQLHRTYDRMLRRKESCCR